MVDGTSRHGAGECGRGDRRAYADIVGLFLHDGASGHQGASGGHQVGIRCAGIMGSMVRPRSPGTTGAVIWEE